MWKYLLTLQHMRGVRRRKGMDVILTCFIFTRSWTHPGNLCCQVWLPQTQTPPLHLSCHFTLPLTAVPYLFSPASCSPLFFCCPLTLEIKGLKSVCYSKMAYLSEIQRSLEDLSFDSRGFCINWPLGVSKWLNIILFTHQKSFSALLQCTHVKAMALE